MSLGLQILGTDAVEDGYVTLKCGWILWGWAVARRCASLHQSPGRPIKRLVRTLNPDTGSRAGRCGSGRGCCRSGCRRLRGATCGAGLPLRPVLGETTRWRETVDGARRFEGVVYTVLEYSVLVDTAPSARGLGGSW